MTPDDLHDAYGIFGIMTIFLLPLASGTAYFTLRALGWQPKFDVARLIVGCSFLLFGTFLLGELVFSSLLGTNADDWRFAVAGGGTVAFLYVIGGRILWLLKHPD